MIKIDNISVMNFENAIRGSRNPMNSQHKSDSYYENRGGTPNYENYILGKNDLDLAKRLCKAGSDHRKFMRQIFVSMDITAPLYWWKEYDTYKVGTTANSTSTMHKIHSKEFVESDFSFDKIDENSTRIAFYIKETITMLNTIREAFNNTKDKKYWYSLIQLLPSSYNQMRTCTMTYENLRNIYHARNNHKLDEWKEFCKVVKGLPYAMDLIIGCEEGDSIG